jgi:hypothetical protein
MLTYVLPIRSDRPRLDLTSYLRWLAPRADVVVVDGSDPVVFAAHADAWGGASVRHLAVDPERRTPMGKVGGVITGLTHARSDTVVIADDDVRYDAAGLEHIERLLAEADVVRPQNVFTDLPWHAWWDTGRTLLARAFGGDWPGTLGVRRDVVLGAGGYAGDVMFENLELVRTVKAAGGREIVARDLFVARHPPTAGHFWRQRVRQAYDEFGRPHRLAVGLAILPAVAVGGTRVTVGIAVASVVLAELGRRRDGGRSHFPVGTTFAAPCWVAERAITSWLAVATRIVRGGVPYGGTVVPRAASSTRTLRRTIAAAPSRDAERLGEASDLEDAADVRGDVDELDALAAGAGDAREHAQARRVDEVEPGAVEHDRGAALSQGVLDERGLEGGRVRHVDLAREVIGPQDGGTGSGHVSPASFGIEPEKCRKLEAADC